MRTATDAGILAKPGRAGASARARIRRALLGPLVAAAALAAPAGARCGAGKATGLAVPRFVSLKTDRVNLREGPSKDNRTAWVFQRAGLPVEIIAEFETWRRIRDSEGTEGWVLHSLLSGRRTGAGHALGQRRPPLRLSLCARDDGGPRTWPGCRPDVIVSVKAVHGRLVAPHHGSAQPSRARPRRLHPSRIALWGVYPNERVE